MKALKNEKTNRVQKMSYQDRLRNYEWDKQRLLQDVAHLPALDISEALKALQEKWKI